MAPLPRQSRRPVILGMGVSVLAHFGLLLPAMIFVMGASTPHEAMTARFEPEDFRGHDEEEQPPPEDQTQLGIEEETEARMTWVGYEEYEEHLARLAEVEQAQFTETPGQSPTPVDAGPSAANPVSEPAPASAAPQSTQAPAEASEAEMERTEQPRPRDQEIEEARESEEALSTEPDTAVEADSSDRENTQSPAPDPSDPQRLDLPVDPTAIPLSPAIEEEGPVGPEPPPAKERPHDIPDDMRPEPVDAPAEPTPKPDSAKAEEKTEAQPSQEQQPQPETTPAATSGGDSPGDPADKESDATSTVDIPIDKIKLGKPIAAHGLELKPRRPELTTLMKLTASPGNPLVEIRFKSNGRVREALILQSCGDPRVDVAIRSSLYRWRARGKELKELGKGETKDIRLRIMLSRRR